MKQTRATSVVYNLMNHLLEQGHAFVHQWLDVLEWGWRGTSVVEGAAGACVVSDIDIPLMSESPTYLLLLEYAPAITHKRHELRHALESSKLCARFG
jgi:hypothetical protein